MKKVIIAVGILLISALVAFLWVTIDAAVMEKLYPLEYAETVEQSSDRYSVPKELIYAVIKTESSFKSDAVSNKGAIGLMQITPDTYSWLCSKRGCDEKDSALLYKPDINIDYGTYYLDRLYSEFGCWENALAAYNAGPENAKKWINEGRVDENGVLNDIPYKETREYVEKVMKARDKYKKLYFEENQ